MNLDLETLLSACALILCVVTAVFATTAALRHNDEANRSWTAGFAAALCVTGLQAIYGQDGATPAIVVAVTDASMVFAVGALWSGCRSLDGRDRSLVWVPVAVAIAVMIPVLLGAPAPNLDLSSALRLGAAGGFAWLCAIELLRGRMGLNLNSRMLQVTFFALGAWFVTAAALSAAAPAQSGLTRPSIESITMPFTAALLVAAICLSALRVELAGNWWSLNAETRRYTSLGILAAKSFAEDARDRLERTTIAGRHAVLVLAEIDHLDDLNTAFGREHGDRAILHFSGVLRNRVPAEALIGHLGAGRFVVMVVSARPDTPSTIVDAIRTGLTEAPVAPGLELRTDATFGTSHTLETSADYDSLLARAAADLVRART